MMSENGDLSPEGKEFRAAMLHIMQTDIMPLLDRHNTEVIEARLDQAVKGLETQLQPLFDTVGKRIETLEALPRTANSALPPDKASTRADQLASVVAVGNTLIDSLLAAATKFLPLLEQYSALKYTRGLTAEAITEMRVKDPIRAATLAQMLNPDPMLNQLPGYTYNILAMGAQAGLRMKQAIAGGATSTDGLPGSTSVPGSPLSTPLPASMPIPRTPSGVSMNSRDAKASERLLIRRALSEAREQLRQAKA